MFAPSPRAPSRAPAAPPAGAAPPRRATMRDVAARAGVATATVSAALSGSAAVSGGTRERVFAAVAALNYRPGPPARDSRAVRDAHDPHGTDAPEPARGAVGLLVKDAAEPYAAAVAAGARAALAERGYTLLVADSGGDARLERRAAELLYAGGARGLLVAPVLDAHADLSPLFELTRRNVPLVLLERVCGVPAAHVGVDDAGGAEAAVRHLVALGHRRVAHLAGPAHSAAARERTEGVRRGCAAARLRLTEADVVPAGATCDDGRRAVRALFAARDLAARPTALTCDGDLLALGACEALAELGLRVPADVSVVGFGDLLPAPAALAAPLTSVRVPAGEVGRCAAAALLEQLDAPERPAPRRLVLESTLTVRGSTAAPAA